MAFVPFKADYTKNCLISSQRSPRESININYSQKEKILISSSFKKLEPTNVWHPLQMNLNDKIIIRPIIYSLLPA